MIEYPSEGLILLCLLYFFQFVYWILRVADSFMRGSFGFKTKRGIIIHLTPMLPIILYILLPVFKEFKKMPRK